MALAPHKAIIRLCLFLLMLLTHSLASANDADRAAAAAVAAAAPVPALLDVILNGSPAAEPVLFLTAADGRLYAAATTFAAWRLRLPTGEPIRFDGDLYYALAAVPGLAVRLDQQNSVDRDRRRRVGLPCPAHQLRRGRGNGDDRAVDRRLSRLRPVRRA